jgi:hypothetical protein
MVQAKRTACSVVVPRVRRNYIKVLPDLYIQKLWMRFNGD